MIFNRDESRLHRYMMLLVFVSLSWVLRCSLLCHFGFFVYYFRSLFNLGYLCSSHFLLNLKFIQRNEWKIRKRNTDIAYSHDGTLKCNGNISIGIFVEFLSNDRFQKRKLNDNQSESWLQCMYAGNSEHRTQSYRWTWKFIHRLNIFFVQ